MSGFGGERGRAHTAIEAASDALAAAFVQHLADIGCNLQYQFANQFAVEKSLAHSAAKSAKPACLALLLQAGTPLILHAGSIFDSFTVAEAAAKGPCAAVAAEGAAEWSVRVAAAQAAPSCPCSLPGAERLRGGGGVGGRELVAAGAETPRCCCWPPPTRTTCSRRKPLTRHHGGDGGGEAAGSEERARRKQVGRSVQRPAAVRAWFTPSSAPSSAAVPAGFFALGGRPL